MRRLLLFVAFVSPMCMLLGRAGTVFAHEIVTAGPFQLTIGWLNEPALAGEKNAVFVSAVNSETGAPVESLTTVKASISIGGRSRDLLLRPLAEDKPGQYVADLIPTVRGVYTLRLAGTLVGESAGGEVDQKLDVSVDLDEVEAASDLQFPEPSPSTLELQKRLAAAEAAAATSRVIAFIALGLSLLVMSVGLAGRARKPKP